MDLITPSEHLYNFMLLSQACADTTDLWFSKCEDTGFPVLFYEGKPSSRQSELADQAATDMATEFKKG